ncbi:MAG TPA: family 20 glycosylhydrolase [Caldilineae bacterium]|nr:family 20 glycosylhydrolase [Caldilineae bacterium]
MAQELVLLPMPQRLHRLKGVHQLRPDRFIWLEGDPQVLLPTGRAIQEALSMVGQRWDLTAARGDDLGRLGATVHIDPSQVPQPEGYHLTIGTDQIRIVAHDPAGAFYAAMTLRQIARHAAGSGELPCLRIEDWPDFPRRGVMLDISRDKVPTMETLYALVDMLAEWKINQFQLYTEHTFAYRNHREVWEKASPMTGEEILALDAYCRERFIELVPNQNSFGHMHRWLIHDRYRPLAECPDGWQSPWGEWHDEPFSLCPLDPGSIELLRELYDELLPHFSSRQFNVGCDETFDLGQGRSKEACEERGVGRVYLEFLLKIHDLVQQHGRTMQFWGDIILQHPELIPELPGDIIALEWGYDADYPFAENSEKFARSGVPYYVCPGTSTWNSIGGRTENAIGNLWNAAENGLAHGAVGYLNTDWGDNGHWQHLPVSFLGYAYGAAVSWAAQANRDIELPRVLDLHAFRDAAGVMGKLAYDLGNAYKVPGLTPHNSSVVTLILLSPSRPFYEGRLAELTVEGLEKTLTYIDQVMAQLPEARMERPDADLIADEFRNAAALLKHGCRLGIARLQADGGEIANIPTDTRESLAEELEGIIEEYKRLWLARNRVGGLEDSVGRMERLLQLYRGG